MHFKWNEYIIHPKLLVPILATLIIVGACQGLRPEGAWQGRTQFTKSVIKLLSMKGNIPQRTGYVIINYPKHMEDTEGG